MNKLGEATLRFALWDIYEAKLYSSGSRFTFSQPFALELRYLRSFGKAQLISETTRQLEKLEFGSREDLQGWMQQLDGIWPDVDRNDTLTLLVDENLHASFYFNRQYIGAVPDPEFARGFAGIWLAENSSRPKLRAKLLRSASAGGK